MESSKPIKTIRIGSIAASIWLRSTSSGVFYDVSVSRSWRCQETGKTGYSQNFSDRELDTMIDAAIEAKAWIEEQKANAKTVTVAA